MRTYLNVPYAEKDEAKRLGARWNPAVKSWYVENLEDLEPFLKWVPAHLLTPVDDWERSNLAHLRDI